MLKISEAEKIVKAFLDQDVRSRAVLLDNRPIAAPLVFRLDIPLDENTVLRTIRGPLHSKSLFASLDLKKRPPRYVFFVDDLPNANWEHPCRYLLVNDDKEVAVIAATAPPSEKANVALLKLEYRGPGGLNRGAENV